MAIMTKQQERDKRHNWKHSSPEIIKVIKSKSNKKWIKAAVDFVYECLSNKKLPFLSSFWRERGIWIYALRQDIGADRYKGIKHNQWLDKYWMIKDILDEGMQENVVSRNIDKSTFAAFFLANQYKWRTTEQTQPTAITFNLSSFTLPSPNSNNATLPPILIDSASQPILEPHKADEQEQDEQANHTGNTDIVCVGMENGSANPIIDSDSDGVVIQDREENVPSKAKKGGKGNSRKGVRGGASYIENTPTYPSIPNNSQPIIDTTLIEKDEYDSLDIPIKENKKVDAKKIKNENNVDNKNKFNYEDDIFAEDN